MLRELGENELAGLTSGYVLNFYSSPQGQYGNTIHPFDCPHIGRMTNPPRKIWADTVAELEAWIREQGAELDLSSPRCQHV
jgi:hypothetical protein